MLVDQIGQKFMGLAPSDMDRLPHWIKNSSKWPRIITWNFTYFELAFLKKGCPGAAGEQTRDLLLRLFSQSITLPLSHSGSPTTSISASSCVLPSFWVKMTRTSVFLPIWGRCYDHNFLWFFPIFGEKIGVFLKNQCYDDIFSKFGFVLSRKRQFFR
jgi:hypothetical protein